MGVTYSTTNAGVTYSSIASFASNGVLTSYVFGASNTLPQTYTDLVLIVNDPNSTGNFDVRVIFNNDTTATYSRTGIRSISGNYTFRQTALNSVILGSYGGANYCRPCIAHIMSYKNSNVYKTVLDQTADAGSAAPGVGAQVQLWRNTNPITQIEVQTSAAMNTGATISLYGILAA
jgi:hypothetical protein